MKIVQQQDVVGERPWVGLQRVFRKSPLVMTGLCALKSELITPLFKSDKSFSSLP
jgi:hypothetical protein